MRSFGFACGCSRKQRFGNVAAEEQDMKDANKSLVASAVGAVTALLPNL